MKNETDVVAYLEKIMRGNTKSYQSDFEYDKETLYEAARKPSPKDRTFYWMSRPCGTWCVLEREVFLRDTEANTIWRNFQRDSAGILTFRVCITGIDESNGKLIGEVFQFRYEQQVERVEALALPIKRVIGTYTDGTSFDLPDGKFNMQALMKHGGIAEKRFEPEDETELENLIEKEHHNQDKSLTKNRRKRKNVERY